MISKREAELGIIGSIVCRNGYGFDETLLHPGDFSPPFDLIIKKILEVSGKGVSDDFGKILFQEVGADKDSGRAYALSQAVIGCYTGGNLHYFADCLKEIIVHERSENIRLQATVRIKAGEDLETVGIELSGKIAELKNRYLPSEKKFKLGQSCIELLEDIEAGKKPDGMIFTGIPPVDELSGGLIPGDYVALAGRPSSGKTTFALNAAVKCGLKTGLISLEMKAKPIASKIISMASLFNTKTALRNPNKLSMTEKEGILGATSKTLEIASRIELYDVEDISSQLDQVTQTMRQMVKNGCKLIVLDYLQLVEAEGENRQAQVSKISRTIKGLLGRLNVPGIILCQLSRDNEKENRAPRMSDLRESGAIEQDADLIWFLHRDQKSSMSDKIREIRFIQAKGRLSGVGCCQLAYNLDSQTFYGMEKER